MRSSESITLEKAELRVMHLTFILDKIGNRGLKFLVSLDCVVFKPILSNRELDT